MKLGQLITVTLLCCVLLACGSNDGEDPLLDSGLLGEWEIAAHSLDPGLDCCEFLVFALDEETDDLMGHLTSHGPEYMLEGTFEFLINEGNLLLFQNDEYELYIVTLSESIMTLSKDETIKTYQRVE